MPNKQKVLHKIIEIRKIDDLELQNEVSWRSGNQSREGEMEIEYLIRNTSNSGAQTSTGFLSPSNFAIAVYIQPRNSLS